MSSKVTRNGLAAVAITSGLAAALSLAVTPAASASSTTGSPTASSSATGSLRLAQAGSDAAIRSYWTRSRLLAARNADLSGAATTSTFASHPDGPAGRVAGAASQSTGATLNVRGPASALGPLGVPWPGSKSSPPATTTGRVFFQDHNGGGWSCSASTVNSGGKNVVFTAGHCVYGTIGGEIPGETWHRNWEFIPDYSNGSAPYGVWTAHQLWTLTNYISSGGSGSDEGDDIGAAVMNTNSGNHIVNVVGGQGIEWNYPENQSILDLGYPAKSPFNGSTLEYTSGTEFQASSSMAGLTSNFTPGSSGGPWLAAFGGTFGYVDGVNDTSNGSQIFAGYFGNNAANLYNSVASL